MTHAFPPGPLRSVAAHLSWLALIALTSLPVGCGSGPAKPTPISAMMDPSVHTSLQVAAVRRAWQAVETGEIDRAAARESLKKVAWARARWEGVRRAAIETLLEDQANLDDTHSMLKLMLPTETQWPIIEFISATAVERGWTDLTTALVRSWSRPVVQPTDALRPERLALEKLHPGRSPEDIVFSIFTAENEHGLRDRDRQDAWTLLRRIDPTGARTIALLGQSTDSDPGDDPHVASLRSAAHDLHAIPETGEQLSWVRQLREPANSPFWTAAAAAVARLNDRQRDGLQLRHAAAVVWAGEHRPTWLSASREELVEQVVSRQKTWRKHLRDTQRSGGAALSELAPAWRDRLSWADALSILLAADVLADPAVARSLFDQTEADRRDNSSEHGGLIDPATSDTGSLFALRPFTPRFTQRAGDNRFVAPTEMTEAGALSLFHYHFHVQRLRNASYAGPSGEDIDYARRFGRSCIVFTSIGPDILNADFYQGEGVVIDLGEVLRPSPSQR